MGLPQIKKKKKLLHCEGNHQQKEKTVYQMGEAICKSYLITGYYPKYIKKLYNSTTTQTQLKHGQNSSTEFFSRKTHRWTTGSWKDAPHLYYQRNEVKATRQYHFTPVWVTVFRKTGNNRCWWRCRDKGTLLHCWWVFTKLSRGMEAVHLRLPRGRSLIIFHHIQWDNTDRDTQPKG